MWPDSKGKGGKDGSPKSKDGGGESKPSSGGKGKGGRSTKTKMKALSATGLPAMDKSEAAAKLEQEIIKAAEMGPGAAAFETKTLVEMNPVPPSAMTPPPEGAPGLMRLPSADPGAMDEKISNLWKNKVLGAYRANPRASQHVLPAMTASNRAAIEVTDKARWDAQQVAMISLVDKMFDSFQNLAFEFNNVAQASDLELTWVRPTVSRENISSWHQAAQVINVFTGRISTRRWTMVVRGTFDNVVAYCIPADKLLSFNNQPANFHPVIQLIPTATGLDVRWSLFGRVVSQDDLANIYRALLDNMIRIAQDDAPSDRFIDLAAYGITLSGEMDPGVAPAVPPSVAMGTEMNYGAKYQDQFMKEESTSDRLPPVATAQQGQYSGQVGGSSADWRPVVSTVRGANPPVPATPMPGSQSNMPSSPGFNQDEPWKFAGGAASVPGQSNPSTGLGMGSFNSFAGGQSFGGQGVGRAAGDQSDEPPLPSLPAHLFEGLPPRPQNFSSGNYGQQAQTGPQPALPNAQPQWAASQSANSGAFSTSSDSDDDGWKSAGISNKAMHTNLQSQLPPLPVTNAQPPRTGPFESSAPSPDIFSSGSIRLDALAREIAQSSSGMPPAPLPPAVPGFEPYSFGESKTPSPESQYGMLAPQPVPPPPPPEPDVWPPGAVPEDEEEDEWEAEQASKPWPKARPATPSEEDLHRPESAEAPQQANPFDSGPQPLQDINAFITPEPVAPVVEQEDPEIAALFEGEPVNAPEPVKKAPEYMSWLDPAQEQPAAAAPPPPPPSPPPPPPPPTAQPWAAPAPESPASESRAVTGEHARAAIEEGFRQAQAAFAAQLQQGVNPFAAPQAVPEAPPAPAPMAVPEAVSDPPAPPAEASVPPPPSPFAQPEPVVPPTPMSSPAISPLAPAELAPDSGARSLKGDIQKLLVTLDAELEAVSARGSEAFAKRDLRGAERLIKLAEILSTYRENLNKLMDEHGQDLS